MTNWQDHMTPQEVFDHFNCKKMARDGDRIKRRGNAGADLIRRRVRARLRRASERADIGHD